MVTGATGTRAGQDFAGLAGAVLAAPVAVRAGHGGLAPRQVGEQGGQVGGGAGLEGATGAVLEFLGGEAAGLVVLAQLGDGPVAVGVGHAQAAGHVALSGGTHVLNATDRRARGHRPRSGVREIHLGVEGRVNPDPGVTGPWLCRTFVLSLFHAVVVPSGFRTRVQPHRWITTW